MKVSGGIEAPGLRLQVEPLARRTQARAPFRGEPRRLPGHARAEHEFGEPEPLDLDLHGEVGQQLAVRLGLGRRRAGHRPAQHLQPPDLQALDLQAAGQQGEAAPDDPGPIELQPHAVPVAHRHVADHRIGGERAVDGADGDARGGGGERLREQAAEHGSLAVVGAHRGRRDGCEDEAQEDGQRDQGPRDSPPPSAGEGGPRSGSGEGRDAAGEGAPLSRPLLTQGPPSPAEGGGNAVAAEQPPESHHVRRTARG